ncbi:sarcosine oxidase subunit gamma [Roseobacter cerasinus]|uniref:Sarcosine oxidase subunit gamma n=1 Tax=Roseobacter cerasinus TaxID=2602289 RepID=A0A640VXH3_9RHOB|nr:sarcosine oxidase subunit gamma family protein [Roseobacter cerasinus]GFE52060.1 sarcosine oxidase subunit gamma [Roseobacter cerasinus]
MSEPMTAGADGGIAAIAEAPLQGMITLRGDLSDDTIRAAVKSATGQKVPERGMINTADGVGVCWMSPDELLILCAHGDVPDKLHQLQESLSRVHALAVNVSDARAGFILSGPHARDVLAKLCPVDLAPDRFAFGQLRRTRLAQVPAAFWMLGEDRFHLICFRSQKQYVSDVLTVSAQPGSAVNVWSKTISGT